MVNHKDLDKENYDSSNLEWVTPSYNLRHAIANGAKTYESHKMPCYQYNKDWEFVAEFSSRKEVQEKLGISRGNVSAVIRKGKGTAGGYFWLNHKLGEEPSEKEEIPWESWKVHPDYPKYHVSSDGRIYSTITNRLMKPTKKGYPSLVLINKNRERKSVSVHSIVAKLYVANPNKHGIVDHIDNDVSSFDSENLQWLTASENSKKAHESGAYANRKKSRLKYFTTYKQKRVGKYLDGKLLEWYPTIEAAARAISKSNTYIKNRCAKDGIDENGYEWNYIVPFIPNFIGSV